MARQREALETTALLKKVKIEMDKIGSDISSSEDELLTGDNNYSPVDNDKDVKDEKDDDQMSLSSLSSNDQKIEESHRVDIPPPIPGHFNPYQHYPGKYIKKNMAYLQAYLHKKLTS